MLKNKSILAIIIIAIMVFAIPTITNAAVEYTKDVIGNDGSITINLSGLDLDTSKSHEFALIIPGEVPDASTTWHTIVTRTQDTATIELNSETADILEVLKVGNEGELYIREKDNTSEYELDKKTIDLSLPYLNAVNISRDSGYTVYPLYGYDNRSMTFKWEKIMDESVIQKYIEYKENGTEILASDLRQSPPTSGFSSDWSYMTNYSSQKYNSLYSSAVPKDGLYYLWIRNTASNYKSIMGYAIHDGLPNATTVDEYLGRDSNVYVESIELDKTKLRIGVNDTYILVATISPENATNKIVTWTSSDEEVATVDNAGKITPKKVGSTIITVTTQDGNKKATCTVTVTGEEPEDDDVSVESVTLNKTEISLEVGKVFTIVPTIKPTNASNKKVTYTTSDAKIARVGSDGVVTAVAEGTATITVTTEDGAKTATCKVIVTKAASGDDKKTFGDHKYLIIEQTMSWEEAKAYCESLGGYLVTITSAEEQKFIEDYINEKGYKNKRFWLGFSDVAKEGTWNWVTGESNKYTNWGKSLDNGYEGTQDYAALVGFDTTYGAGKKVNFGQWDDVQKSKQSDCYFICEWGEYKKDTTTTTTVIPDAGKTIAISMTLVAVAALGVVGFVKYRKYKDV